MVVQRVVDYTENHKGPALIREAPDYDEGAVAVFAAWCITRSKRSMLER